MITNHDAHWQAIKQEGLRRLSDMVGCAPAGDDSELKRQLAHVLRYGDEGEVASAIFAACDVRQALHELNEHTPVI